MGNVRKFTAGAIGIAAALAILAVSGWWACRFLASGPGHASVVKLDIGSSPAPSPHKWTQSLPLISIATGKRTQSLPSPIQLGRQAHAGLFDPIRLPGPGRFTLPKPIAGVSGDRAAPMGINPIVLANEKPPQIAPIVLAAAHPSAPPLIALAGDHSAIPPLISIASAGPSASPPTIALTTGAAAAAVSPITIGAIIPHADPATLTRIVSDVNTNIESLRYDDDILDPDQQHRRYCMAMCVDHQGNLWVGTIGQGIWRCQPADGSHAEKWTKFTTADGLGDDNGYALACDRKGRIWIGHLNHGVSVFNDQKWQNYDVIGGLPPHAPPPGTPGEGNSPSLGTPGEGRGGGSGGGTAATTPSLSGPLGERIFHIAVNPADGDVWICSSAGLARYSESHDTWTYYTRADGLPSDQANGIAFSPPSPDGHVFVATQCDGVAIATLDSAGNPKNWHTVTSPYPNQPGPSAPTGPGLPCNLTNDILVTPDGTVYCATDAGLAWSTDDGETWQYLRGKDWADKINQSAAGPPADWTDAIPKGITLLEKDYITCLAESSDGHLFLGYQQAGWPRVAWRASPVTNTIELGSGTTPRRVTEVFAATSLAVGPAQLCAGTYAKEIFRCDLPGNPAAPFPSPPVPEPIAGGVGALPPSPLAFPPLPSGAPTPTLADLNAELAAMAKVPPLQGDDAPKVMALDEDWLTDGRWLGRYGRWTAVLCSMLSPFDYVWGAGPEPMGYVAQIGPHNRYDDSLRYWIGGLQTSGANDLEIPPVYMDSRVFFHYATPRQDRRPAVWDDHGEAYSGTWEGPDIYCTVHVPAGTFILTLCEQDGFSDRDLDIVIRNHQGDTLYNIDGFDGEPTLATSRTTKFDGNVYKRFLVHGPTDLTLKVARNYSFLTTVSAIFLDLPDERPLPYFTSADQWMASKQQAADRLAARLSAWKTAPDRNRADPAPQPTPLSVAKELSSKLGELRDWNPQWWAANHRRVAVLLARWGVANVLEASPVDAIALKASALYEAHDYGQWEACQHSIGERTARDVEKSLSWDHVIKTSSGKERQILAKYLSTTPAATKGL